MQRAVLTAVRRVGSVASVGARIGWGKVATPASAWVGGSPVAARASWELRPATTAATSGAAAVDADGSDADFKPKVKTSPDDPAALKKRVDELVAGNPVVLFMKGTKQQPMCGFSNRVVQLLYAHGVDFKGVDILSDPVLRNYMKEYSQWPTFPQLYIGGEFVGGCDIATQMHQNGELAALLAAKGKKTA